MIKLINSELIKMYLYLKFEGTCGIGSDGNSDLDYIIDTSKKTILDTANVQALILDFTGLNYTFGNRFIKIFEPNVFKNNSNVFVSIIIDKSNLEHWKSLIEFAKLNIDLYGNEKSVFQNDLKGAIKSINIRMNKKTNAQHVV